MAISSDGMSSSESVGFGSQFIDSFKGIVTGFVMFPLSIFLIYKVETCTQAGDAFKNAKPVSQMEEGKPVYITGKLSASPFGTKFVKDGSYIAIEESSEVYAWDEEERTEGEGSNKKKIRECKLKWTTSPDNPSSFQLPACKAKAFHQRREKSVNMAANGGKITADGKTYNVDLADVNLTSAVPSSTPSSEEIITNGYTLSGNYLYSSATCASNEVEGCERVSVKVTPVPSGDMTFLGKLNGDTLGKYTYKDDSFLNASVGDYAQTMAAVKSDDAAMKWVGRICGFIMMWAGLSLLVGPVTMLLDFIPFVGTLGSSAIRFFMGVVAFVLTTITILLVKFWYIWLLLIIGGLGYGYYKKKNASATPQST
ncbi:MAG TPA: TMEM43 family protein [Leptospiraceae bacterium]|nr:TMEM43 family protein [Leptospiraceae bacterium]HMW05482.1 TMEM43 family protein [Leptospiraceae bacterium]HMX33211.1 TMEM43 family protein [Leptospiraceae bacterium]HMY30992.1 TMEM43 family protein [Leptospiraceae bacterium]HMZ64394.1 TMEM43 family protein [Leptospiraceae bacterium]